MINSFLENIRSSIAQKKYAVDFGILYYYTGAQYVLFKY